MSKLEELIARLCPDGVEYKELGEVCYIQSGWGFPNKEQGCLEGDYPFFKVSDMNLLGNEIYMLKANNYISTDTAKRLKCKPTPEGTIIFPKIGAAIGTNKKRITTGDSCYDNNIVGLISKEAIIYKYLYYVFDKVDLTSFADYSGAMPSIRKSTLEKFKVPVPPLEVQREIVRILDSFTFLTAELAAELAARQKQYEWYRDMLLTFDDVHAGGTSSVTWKRLDELFPFIRNGFVGTIKNHFTNKENGVRYLEGTNIHDGVISDNEVLYVTKEFHEKHKKNELKPDDILMVQSGHIGECAIVGEKYAGANCHALIIMSNGGNCISKFYVHYFHTLQGFKSLNPAITGGTIKHVLAGKMGKILVPVPSLSEQQRIVDILDRFDALCNDITSGLPAEIEARKKQYEYYRDKLLTFKELKKEA